MTVLSLDGISGPHGRSRPDLQGLRAVAVLAVIAYHFGVPGVPGGFAGVDIFFVLSGFFISRLLMQDIEGHGRIRLARFWANRAKRLLPNGLLVVICVLGASVLLLPSYRLPGISEDALSAAAFFANFHFAARAVDYFHLDDPASPLLHYWSLAVEEQFYFVLPPLLMTVAALLPSRIGARKAGLVLLGLIVVASLAASLTVMERSQPEAFFHPQYRAWQLALGGLTGLLFDWRERVPQAVRASGAILGVFVVTASLVLLGDAMPYPGVRALAPTLGTAAVIFGLDAGPAPIPIARMLSLPPVVLVGDMSYSLYLWHWPVSVFLAALWPGVGAMGVVAGLAATTLLASAAYHLIERPIHLMKLPPASRYGPLPALAAGAACVTLAAGASAGVSLLPSRTDPALTALIAEATADMGPNYGNGCHRDLNDVDQPDCRFGRLGGPRVVLFGDSHAAQWFTALVAAATEAGWEVNAWTKTSCPAADVTVWYPPTRSIYRQCGEWRERRLRALRDDPPELIVLGNSTGYYGWIFDEARGRVADRPASDQLWREGMVRTGEVLAAAGIRVVELRDTPRMYAGYKDCLSSGRWADCGRTRADALAGMADPERKPRLDLSDALCGPEICPATMGDKILYRDSHHLTATHVASLYRHFLELLPASRASAKR